MELARLSTRAQFRFRSEPFVCRYRQFTENTARNLLLGSRCAGILVSVPSPYQSTIYEQTGIQKNFPPFLGTALTYRQ